MASTASLIFALIAWPLIYIGLLRIMRRARIPSPFGFEFLVAFATIGELFLLPLYPAAPFSMLLYAGFYFFFAVLSLVCIVRLLLRPSRSRFYPAALILLIAGIAMPWVCVFVWGR